MWECEVFLALLEGGVKRDNDGYGRGESYLSVPGRKIVRQNKQEGITGHSFALCLCVKIFKKKSVCMFECSFCVLVVIWDGCFSSGFACVRLCVLKLVPSAAEQAISEAN